MKKDLKNVFITDPSGRMPFAVPKPVNDLPLYEDYSMKRRTYKYMEKEALFPFWFGLSYS